MGTGRPLSHFPFLRAAIDGLMVVVPIGAVILLVLGILHALRDATAPLAGQFLHPMIIGVLLFVAICLAVGYLVRSAIGRAARRALEATLFEKIPGYRLLKAFAAEGPLAGGDGRSMQPAIVAFDDMRCPAVVMDRLADGQLIVFLPGTPSAMSGTVHIMTADRVTVLDTPLLPFLKAVSSWGLGLATLIAAEPAGSRPAPQPATERGTA